MKVVWRAISLMRKHMFTSLTLLLSVVVSATGQTRGVIKIATQSPLSGGQAALGEGIKLGATLAIEKFKGNLEKQGFRIELLPFDDQAKPDVGVANAKNIVADKDILVVIGHLNSGVAIPASEVYKQADLAMISPANTNATITDRGYLNVFRVVGRDDVQGVAGSQFAHGTLKTKSVYILHDKTTYGQGVAEFFKADAEKKGIKILGFEGTEEKSNFVPVITPIKSKNPDLIYFGGIYEEAAPFFKQAREKGIKARFMGPDGLDSSDLVSIGGKSVFGTYYTSVAGPATLYPQAKAFVEEYKKKFGKNPEPFATQAYDATAIAMKAIEAIAKTGKTPTRDAVTAAIRGTTYAGITGPIAFDDKGDLKTATYWVFQVAASEPAKWSDNKAAKRLTVDSDIARGALGYATVAVYYGTDRNRTGASRSADYYGSFPGSVELGVCEVSIPYQHRLGRLETPYFRFLADPSKHVILLTVQDIDRNRWLAEVTAKVKASQQGDAFVFIHGYNVTFEDACRRTAQLAYDLKFPGAPLMWSWPSNGTTLDYIKDLKDADWSAANLRAFLIAVARESRARTIHVVAHSMGSRVATRALADISTSTQGAGRVLFNQVVLTAPDIDRGLFLQLAAAVRSTSRRVTLYASSRDKALQLSNSLQGGPRAGEAGDNLVVVDGVDTIDASSVDTSLVGHSYYGDKVSVIADLFELLHLQKPPGQRFHLAPRTRAGQAYWEFRQQ